VRSQRYLYRSGKWHRELAKISQALRFRNRNVTIYNDAHTSPVNGLGNWQRFRRHCDFTVGICHAAKRALNRPNPCAEEIVPIVTLLKEFPHLTVNIGSLLWPNIAIQEYLLAAVVKQHGAMGAHPIRIELVKENVTELYGSKKLPRDPLRP
jgi:hypothetical protein